MNIQHPTSNIQHRTKAHGTPAVVDRHPSASDTKAMLLVRIAHADAATLQTIRHRELPDTPGLTQQARNELDAAIDARFSQLNAQIKPAFPQGRWG